MREYLEAVRTVLTAGTRKENRTGIDTLSTFGVHYNIDVGKEGFPLLTTKKVSWKNIVVENLWFLSGAPTIELLRKHGCKFWDAWADGDGRVPSAYGNFWRRFPVHGAEEDAYTVFDDGVGGTYKPDDTLQSRDKEAWALHGFNDQIAWVIDELKRNPMSRRLVVSAWAPGNAQTSRLPPCHIQFILNTQMMPVKCPPCGDQGCLPYQGDDGSTQTDCKTRDSMVPHLCLHLTQRSCDIALGVPYNIAGYAFLLSLFARFADLPVGIFSHTLVDAHAYTSKPDGSMAEYDHVPGLREQLTRETRKLPTLKIHPSIQSLDDINDDLMNRETSQLMEFFELEGYNPHPAIKFKVAV